MKTKKMENKSLLHLFLKDSGKIDLLRGLQFTLSPSNRATFSPFVTYTGFCVRHTSDLWAKSLL